MTNTQQAKRDLFRRPPKIGAYSGLTIIMSYPSRFDTFQLLSAKGGSLLDGFLRPQFNQWSCEVRMRDCREEFLPGTKAVLLLGQSAMHLWVPETRKNNLNEMRGSVLNVRNIPAVATFHPQDAVDPTDHEARLNTACDRYGAADDDRAADDSDEKGHHGATKRKNYRFWLQKDVQKVKRLMGSGFPVRAVEPKYFIYPDGPVVIELLTCIKNDTLYFDIETDIDLNVLCFSFSFLSNPDRVYVVPLITHEYKPAYSCNAAILRALGLAIADNTSVAHNGSKFDWLVLARKYRIPWGRKMYDTMIAHHRCFPDVEKSLGHCTSLWTDEPFHKDEGGGGYFTSSQAEDMWKYCGKDVWTMYLIHKAITEYSENIRGLPESIQQAMDSISPYMTCSFQGIKYDNDLRKQLCSENDRLMEQYNRIITLLVGEDTIKRIAGKSKSPMPGSNLQCVRYFHDELGYKIVGYGGELKDGGHKPSLAKGNMFKLKLEHSNPVIDLCLAYRRKQLETSKELNFKPHWRE